MTLGNHVPPKQSSLPFPAAAGTMPSGSDGRSAAKTAPFSIRLTVEERRALEHAANGIPLGTYIRSRILDNEVARRKTRRAPVADQAAIARVLAQLGQSRLGSNLNQLAKAANMGALIVSSDVTAELAEACASVTAMREDLMLALGLKGGAAS